MNTIANRNFERLADTFFVEPQCIGGGNFCRSNSDNFEETS
jgi:hypothetical protein